MIGKPRLNHLRAVLGATLIASIMTTLGCGPQGTVEPSLVEDEAVRKATGEAALAPGSGGQIGTARNNGPAQRTTSMPARLPSPTPVIRPAITPKPTGTPSSAASRIAGTPSVPPSPHYNPLLLNVDQDLDQAITALLGAEVEDYGVVVKRLNDGRGVRINPEREFYAASL